LAKIDPTGRHLLYSSSLGGSGTDSGRGVAVEAAVRFGWDRWLGPRGAFIGMEGFGASAPAEALFPHFGITPEKVAQAARSLL